ncbi:MAG: aminoacyl-tRNA hydrolase [Vicinamibacteria bacterium]|nr:aminoacyl-tRNA hydrolase [Vicinamibacteria bacterium]
MPIASQKLNVAPGVTLDPADLGMTTSRSSGPGGQNVNKVASRVTIRVALDTLRGLSAAQRARIMTRLGARVSRDGVLRVTSQSSRSQSANRRSAMLRLIELLRRALVEQAPRTRTRATAASRARRLDAKRHHGRLKKTRGPSVPD